MRTAHAIRGLLLLLLALLGAIPAVATVASPASCRADDRSAACRFNTGILWKIERDGHKPSYLFGTIHLSDPRVTNVPVPVRKAFDAAGSFTMEMIVDGDAMTHMAQATVFSDGRKLDALIGAERFAAVQRAFRERGLPQTDLSRLKPWFAATVLMIPAQTNFLDLQLYAEATLKQKPTYGLETAHEQIAVFNELSLDDQLILLDEALRLYDRVPAQVEEMVKVYLARDLAGMARLMKQQELRNTKLNDLITRRLLIERNQRMVERMRPRLKEGNAFIAVGAGHLPGEQGLLRLLEQDGYRVSPVY